MILTNIQTQLFQWQDKEYANFMSKLMPTVDSDRVIGVRTPVFEHMQKNCKTKRRAVYRGFATLLF